MICVSIGRSRHKMMIAEHRFLAERGAKLVELRLDYLSRTPDVGKLLKDRPTPCVMTCRRPNDQGKWRDSEDQRLLVLRSAIIAGVEYVDLEADIAKKIPRYGDTKRIISHHDFEETPANLAELHKQLCELDPDIVKLVTTAQSPADVVRMMELVQTAEVPTIGFCMGEQGLPSRLLCGRYGSPFTYASFSRDRQMAPGQLSFAEMQNIYRYDAISQNTRLLGVVGDPIAHSLSPHIHNPALAAGGIDATYLPIRVFKGKLAESIRLYEKLGLQGISVTIPHKHAALEFAGEFVEPVQDIGAANTLWKTADGKWAAGNTDCAAALECIRLGLGRKTGSGIAATEGSQQNSADTNLAGKKVLMLGAGGVARAIGYGVTQAGAQLTIANRTAERANELAESLGGQTVGWENRGTGFYDVLVNCTSVGMHPQVDETPFSENWLREGLVVFDTVYTPEHTLLLKQATARNCRVVSGIEMFVRQAAAQFEQFTGKDAPLDVMTKALREAISPVNHN